MPSLCEPVAVGTCHFKYLPSLQNPSDILTKNLPWAKACASAEHLLLLPWKGETTPVTSTTQQRGVTG